MPYIGVRGVDLYYEQCGSEGPHLVVAHGLMGSIALTELFGERAEALAAKGLRVTAYDARGHGRSGLSTRRADYQWAALAEDMHALIVALGLERTSVYGGSMGAGTALVCALDHPDVIDKLILRAPPPFGREAMTVARRTFGGLSVLFQLLGVRATARLVSMLPDARRALEANPRFDMRAFLGAQHRASVVPAIRGLLFDEPQLPAHRFAELTQRTLVMAHPRDPVHPLASGELLHERMAHARLAVAPTATYWERNPEALTHVVAAFVKDEAIAAGLPEKVVHQH